MKKTTGYLSRNENDRYGIRSQQKEWIHSGLHCGEILEIFFKGKWMFDRIEMSTDWYLVNSGLRGRELENLKVRI